MKKVRARTGGLLVGASVLAVILSACAGGGRTDTDDSSSSSGGGAGDNSGYTVAMITHETPGDTFWDKIKSGAQQAAKNYGITLKYSNDPDPGKQATLIQNAIDSKVDGIATTLATPDALAGVGQGGRRPRRSRSSPSTPASTSTRTSAPDVLRLRRDSWPVETAGERITEDGGKNVLCVIQASGSVALETRCAGVKGKAPGTENIQVNGADDSAVVSSLQAKLSQDKSIDYIVTLGAPIALDALKAMDAAGSKAKLITFDLNADAAQDIKDGKIEFSIDQQPYVQGYMAVTALYLNLKNGNDIGGGGPVLTGPSFVDKSNIDAILPFAQKGTR